MRKSLRMNGAGLQTRSNSIVEVKRVRASSTKRSASLPKTKVLPGRKLTDAVVRSSSGLDYGFTSDIPEPISKRVKEEAKEPESAINSYSDMTSSPKISMTCAYCFWSVVVLAFSCVLMLGFASFSFGWMQSRCEFLHNLKYDLQEFKQNFTDTIIGQHYADSIIPSVLADFQEDTFTEPRIVWCVGWTGVGKSKSLDLMKHLVNHSSVHYILPSLLPQTNDELKKYTASTLLGMNSCLKNIVIVDGWDEKYDNTTMKFVSGFLSGVREKAREILHMNQLLVFIAGTRSGEVVNREYLARRQRGERRDRMTSSAFAELLSKTEEFDLIKALGPVTTVPFLPLEFEQVAECARREIYYFKKVARNLSGMKLFENIPLDHILQKLLEHLPLFPVENLVIPATGCKKVASVLTHLIENELVHG